MNELINRDTEHLRSRIEQVLGRADSLPDPSTATVEGLLHDLSVYLEELEFQNDELIRARESLRLSEERFRTLFEDAPVGYVIYDEQLRLQDANRTFLGMLGRGSAAGLRMDQLVDPADQDEFYFHVRDVCRGPGKVRGQFRLAGTRGISHVQAESNLLVEGGRRLIRTALMDVSAEHQLHEQLRRNDRKLRLYLDSVPQPVLITDAEGNIQYSNTAVSEFYGYEPREVLGRNPRLFNPGIQTYRNLGFSDQAYKDLFDSLWSTVKDQKRGTWDGMVINRRKDGALLYVKLAARSIFDADGHLESIIALPVDVSGMKKLEKRSRIDLYQTIANLSELRDNETGNHMRRVGMFARRLARHVGQGDTWCDDIELFAPMHDIGKVGIPDSILLAPRPLGPEEVTVMHKHTELGYAIVAGKSELEMAAEITRYHHERWDGTGYPEALAGADIPLAARIVSVVDVYDALRSRRPYKPAWDHDTVVATIASSAGGQFDPLLVKAFMELEAEFERIYKELAD